jgi:hypothetical protein
MEYEHNLLTDTTASGVRITVKDAIVKYHKESGVVYLSTILLSAFVLPRWMKKNIEHLIFLIETEDAIAMYQVIRPRDCREGFAPDNDDNITKNRGGQIWGPCSSPTHGASRRHRGGQIRPGGTSCTG